MVKNLEILTLNNSLSKQQSFTSRNRNLKFDRGLGGDQARIKKKIVSWGIFSPHGNKLNASKYQYVTHVPTQRAFFH